MATIRQVSDITNAFYINLTHRMDRKEHVEQQLASIGIAGQRFNAIQCKSNGALGCSYSHIQLLTMALRDKMSHILIVEDDITFLRPEVFCAQFKTCMEQHGDDWDVILFAGNNIKPWKYKDDACIQPTACQTTTGYLVNQHYVGTLLQNFREGVQKLYYEPENHVLYAIDKYWFRLQEVDKWYLIIPTTVIQKPGYSDIEQRHVNYTGHMLKIA
jgi:glycosyl transferase, family 25